MPLMPDFRRLRSRQAVAAAASSLQRFSLRRMLKRPCGRRKRGVMSAHCELLVVPRRPFLELIERRPELAVGLLVVFCERLRRTNEQVEDLAFLDLETRIAKTLLRLAQEAETAPDASRLGIKISQRALGE